jgi:hypothetical protein
LHWLFWGLGDWILWPFLHVMSPRLTSFPAPLGWGIVAVLVERCTGWHVALPRRDAAWARYAVYSFFAFAFFALLIHAMVVSPLSASP